MTNVVFVSSTWVLFIGLQLTEDSSTNKSPIMDGSNLFKCWKITQ